VLVEVGGELAVDDGESPPQSQPEVVLAGRAVERGRDRGAPVDDDGVVGGVFDVATTDVPAGAVELVDAAEEVTGSGGRQVGERLFDGDFDVLLGEVVRGGVVGHRGGEARDHLVAASPGPNEVGLLGGQVGEQVDAHRDRRS
jgi:hypothetical protein